MRRGSFGAVAFVPLVGEVGWAEDARLAASGAAPASAQRRELPEMIAGASEALPDLDDPAFGRLFERFADCRVLLLGEATWVEAMASAFEAGLPRTPSVETGGGLRGLVVTLVIRCAQTGELDPEHLCEFALSGSDNTFGALDLIGKETSQCFRFGRTRKSNLRVDVRSAH